MILKLYVIMLKIINLGRMIWPEIYETEPDWFLKVELLLNDFLTFFKIDQTSIKDPLHQTENLI